MKMIGELFCCVKERPPQIPETTLSELHFILNVEEGWPVCVPVAVCVFGTVCPLFPPVSFPFLQVTHDDGYLR